MSYGSRVIDLELPDAIQEWEVPREPGFPWPDKAAKALERLRAAKTERQRLTQLKSINDKLQCNYRIEDLPEKPWDLRMDISVHSHLFAVQEEATTKEGEGPRTSESAVGLHKKFWQLRIARQQDIDASITARADYEYLYDKPYEDNGRVRVAGPFTVESLSPHRALGVDENDELIDGSGEDQGGYGDEQGFVEMVLENLRSAGVQQAHKEDRIEFTSLTPWGEVMKVFRI